MKKEYKLKTCHKCGNAHIKIVIGEPGLWQCNCGWKSNFPKEIAVSEEEYIEFVDASFNKEVDKNLEFSDDDLENLRGRLSNE